MTVPSTGRSGEIHMTRGFFTLLLADALGTAVAAGAAPLQRSADEAVDVSPGGAG